MDGSENNERTEIFSKAVRAGKRTYFFDVKATKGNDYYLTVTESKKRFSDDGKFHYEKHKLFLYKEDFEKFSEGLTEAIDKIKSLQAERGDEPEDTERSSYRRNEESTGEDKPDTDFTNVDFEDLDK
ncbi:MAG: PUR family DNA/RNA-binding protein [Bacteroidota bacterium]|nr:PUR family DNA/RNA-binding protein [Bacteroidota bacterium]